LIAGAARARGLHPQRSARSTCFSDNSPSVCGLTHCDGESHGRWISLWITLWIGKRGVVDYGPCMVARDGPPHVFIVIEFELLAQSFHVKHPRSAR